MGKTLPMGPKRTKSHLDDQKMNKKDFFGYHPRGCKSRVEAPCGHDGRGLHWGPRFAASSPTRFFFALLLQLVYVRHSKHSLLKDWQGFTFTTALNVNLFSQHYALQK